VNALISAFDAAIDLAVATHSKSGRTLRRDKAMTQVALLTGVRIDELLRIRLSDFQPDPRYPQFGPYALLSVIGKGSKLRVVRLYNPLIVDVMTWYLTEVRPGFLTARTTDPDLLFLSERGGVIDDEQYRRSLARIGLQAGIPFKVKPHGLRHTYATHMAPVIGPRELQEQMGHEHLSTTLSNYYHSDPEKVGNQVHLGINKAVALYDPLLSGFDHENFPL
jgi:integrase